MVRLEGKEIVIRQTEAGDLDNILGLWNNGEVMKWVGYPQGLGVAMEKMHKWYDYISQNNCTNSFVVVHPEIGFCGELFYDLDNAHKRAGLDIKFLPEARGKGIAAEALSLLINYIFNKETEAQSVWTEPSIDNSAARKLYTKCGLKESARPLDMEPADSFWELTRVEWKQKA